MIVIEAKDGKEAVEIFKKSKEHSYDLILMDKIAQYC
jgi:YesN/AraC family two-component response regulator